VADLYAQVRFTTGILIGDEGGVLAATWRSCLFRGHQDARRAADGTAGAEVPSKLIMTDKTSHPTAHAGEKTFEQAGNRHVANTLELTAIHHARSRHRIRCETSSRAISLRGTR
jgi:hypothetical protein